MFIKLNRRPAASAGASSSTPVGQTESLLQQGQDWEADKLEALEKSEARAWSVTRYSSAITILAVTALVIMLPFYKVIPVIFEVDRASGEVMQAITDPSAIKSNDLLAKNMLATYVSRRERYHWTLLDDDYEAVLGMSDENVAREYTAIYEGPNALDKKLGDGTDIRVKIITVELSPNEPEKRGTVTWERRTRRNNQETGGAERFKSAMSFKFSPPNVFKREKVLIANPFGFKVDGYAVATVLIEGGGSRK